MAVVPIQLELIKRIVERRSSPLTMLSLGYPDVLASVDTIKAIFGEAVAERLEFRGDSDGIIAWHGLKGELDRVPESRGFFASIGIDIHCIDIVASRGIETIVDLNHPLPETFAERYDLVLDPGTIEHCANIGQAMMNLASAVRAGGSVLHANPLSMFNHGFYNLNPTLYADFYEHNGYVIDFMSGMVGRGLDRQFFKVPTAKRFLGVPPNAVIVVVARRIEARPLEWPVQRKYVSNSRLLG